MTKRLIFILLSLTVAIGLTTSCILDPQETKKEEVTEPVVFKDLTEQDHVLYNLQLAYNERNTTEYDKLLDENFTFIFSEEDYNNQVVEFDQWDRVTEVLATASMMDPNSDRSDRVIQIDLTITYAEGNWSEVPPNETHPDESWFTKTVDYDLTIQTADEWEYRALGLQAQFTIRKAQTEDAGEIWRIRIWRDDVGQ